MLENGNSAYKTIPGSKFMTTKALETNAKSQSKEFAAALEFKESNKFGEKLRSSASDISLTID